MRRPVTHSAILLLGLCAFIAGPTHAQQAETTSPHGDWVTTIACSDCHSADAWTPLSESPAFDHAADGGFELIAAHDVTVCASCHENLEFSPPKLEPRACADCHVDVHAGNLIQSCDACHNSSSFLDVDGISIHQQTTFPLFGAHEVIACESCHTDDFGGLFMQNETQCVSCHEAEYAATTVIPHAERGFSLDCESCHTQHVWEDAVFPEHALIANGFELVGAHEFAGCESCHVQPSFELVFDAANQEDCIACHQAEYDEEHKGRVSIFCLQCHNQSSWEGADD